MKVAVGSLRGAPGATTLALAMSWEFATRGRPVLLIEADPAGGVLAGRLGAPVSPGLVEFTAAAHRARIADIAPDHVQQLTPALCLLPAPTSSRQTVAALDALIPDLVPLFGDTLEDVVVDVGRLLAGSPSWPLADTADLIVLVARPVVSELATLVLALRELRETGLDCVAAIVDCAARSAEPAAKPAEVRDVLADAAAVCPLPFDPIGVRRLYGDPTGARWHRTRLASATAALVSQLLTEAPVAIGYTAERALAETASMPS